jgi:hypothetical protein
MARTNVDDLSAESHQDLTPVRFRQAPKLSPQERFLLGKLEVTIDRGLKSFTAVGDALKTIRNQGLYREKYPNFETYCRARWPGMGGASRARQLIAASDVARDLAELPVKPISEIQMRPLVALDADTRKEVWQHATESEERPTEKTIKAVIRDIVPSDPDERAVAARDTAALVNHMFVLMLETMNIVRGWHNIDEGLSSAQTRELTRGLTRIRNAMRDVETALGREV